MEVVKSNKMDRESTTGENFVLLVLKRLSPKHMLPRPNCVTWRSVLVVGLLNWRGFVAFHQGGIVAFPYVGVKIKLRHSHLLIRRGSETMAMALAEYS